MKTIKNEIVVPTTTTATTKPVENKTLLDGNTKKQITQPPKSAEPSVKLGTKTDVAKSQSEPISDVDNLPEKFFDDPVLDAKVRNTEYKDPQDEEWNRFQKEIKDVSTQSYEIIAGEQEGEAINRELYEINEQIEKWSKVIAIEEKKVEIFETKTHRKRREATPDDDLQVEDDDLNDFDEFSDWRAKKWKT